MNGHTEMPLLTFGEDCDYDTLDSILNGNSDTAWKHHGVIYGWAVRIWLKQGVIITALWGWTNHDYEDDVTKTSLLAWSEKDRDYNRAMRIPTDDITRLEIL